MNAVIETTEYLSEIKFMNAVRKAGVNLNKKSDRWSRSGVHLGIAYDINGNEVYNWDKKTKVATHFVLTALEVRDAMKLHAAGFEIIEVEIKLYGGERKQGYAYGKKAN